MPPSPSRRAFLAQTAAFAALAATPGRAEPSPADLQGDIALLRRAYIALHPGLLRYNSAEGIGARFDALSAWAATPRTMAETYIALARITASVRCGHSYPNFYNQTDGVQAALFGGRTRLPLHFGWIGGRMIVLRDLSGLGVPPGSEIEALGPYAATALLALLMPLARADGANDAKRRSLLGVTGGDRWEAFDLYLPMLLPGLFRETRITATVRLPDGRHRRIDLPLMTAEERAAAYPTPKASLNAPLWRLDDAGDGVAWLTMPSWAVYDSKWAWRAWLDERLDRLADERARALVIDLRGNEGGEDCGDIILSRLIDRDIPRMVETRRVRYRRVPDDLSPSLKTWDKSFRDWGDAAVGPDAEGFYRLSKGDADGDVIAARGRRCRGKVIVLTGPENSSATFGFAKRVKDTGLGTLVGATTGGNRRGINGGAFFFLRLPASGLEVDVPLIGAFPPTPEPDAGVEPDVAVPVTAASIAAGTDPVRAAALRVARG